jgi:hypothetical protein
MGRGGGGDAFLAAGEAALSTRPSSGEDLESARLKVKLGADRTRPACRFSSQPENALANP